MGPRKLPRFLRRTARGGRASGRIGYSAATREETSGIPETYQPSDREGKQRSRYETLIFTRLVLLVAVPLLIVGLLCGILYYRSEPARGRAKLGEVAGNASMRMTSVFDGLRSYYLAALRNSSFTWMESCSEIPYSRYSDLRDAQELLRGGTYMDSYVVGYEYINLRYGWVLSNYGTFPLEQMKIRRKSAPSSTTRPARPPPSTGSTAPVRRRARPPACG